MKKITYFRISLIEELVENNLHLLKVEVDLIPKYEGLFIDIQDSEKYDTEVEKQLKTDYEKYKDYIIKRVPTVIRDLAVEAWNFEGKEKRANKLEKNLKMKLIDEEYEYLEDHLLLKIYLVYKPFLIPIFTNNFLNESIVYSEDLNKDLLKENDND